MCFNESPGSTTNMVTEVLLHFLAASGGQRQDKAWECGHPCPRWPRCPHLPHSAPELSLGSGLGHWPVSLALGEVTLLRRSHSACVCPHCLSLLSPLSLSATVQLSPAPLHKAEPANPRLSCRRAGSSHRGRPATKPVIDGLDLTGKLLLWDASLRLLMLSFLLVSRQAGSGRPWPTSRSQPG